MSQPTTPAVDHHAHLTLVVDAHLFGCVVIVDLVHHLDLGVVIPCSQRPKLQHNSRVTDLTNNLSAGFLRQRNERCCADRNLRTCGSPLFLALEETLFGSACSILPYSSQCSLSSAQA